MLRILILSQSRELCLVLWGAISSPWCNPGSPCPWKRWEMLGLGVFSAVFPLGGKSSPGAAAGIGISVGLGFFMRLFPSIYPFILAAVEGKRISSLFLLALINGC